MRVCLLAVCALLTVTPALAIECPEDMKAGCKVLFLTPEEQGALINPNGLLDTAGQARKLDYGGLSQYFITRIKDAPAGEVKPQSAASPTPTPAPAKK